MRRERECEAMGGRIGTSDPSSLAPMLSPEQAIAWFADLGREDTAVAGGKGANLGEVTAAGFPVPPGFVITAGAYLASMEAGRARAALAAESATPATDPDLAARCERLRALVRRAGMPDELRHTIGSAYAELGRRVGEEHPLVAVRSSATAEDAADTSFAGMNRTFTNLRGHDALITAVVEAWASLFAERVLVYRSAHGVTAEPAIAVVVQVMVAAVESAGVAFTADPVTGDRTHRPDRGAFGQGEVVVGGRVEPDTYVVARRRCSSSTSGSASSPTRSSPGSRVTTRSSLIARRQHAESSRPAPCSTSPPSPSPSKRTTARRRTSNGRWTATAPCTCSRPGPSPLSGRSRRTARRAAHCWWRVSAQPRASPAVPSAFSLRPRQGPR